MTKTIVIEAAKSLNGTVFIPGDKSLSHRSVMLAGLANKRVQIKNFLHAQDCLSTAACMQGLGVTVEFDEHNDLFVTGNGLYGLAEPTNVLDAGNSGTTLRLLTGILACQPFFSAFTGDASLRKRPMGRVITPLTQMGCKIYGRSQSRYLPLAILPGEDIQGIEYSMPMSSAQVKSAILLAGLFANSATLVTEPYVSRDHTERMLESFGVNVDRSGTSVKITPVSELQAPNIINIAGDISSAAFWLVAGTIIPNSKLLLKHVGMNPTRTGILDVLCEMGANIEIVNEQMFGTEPIADIIVQSSELQGVEIGASMIPRLIDEIPVLTVAALFAKGTTTIVGAEELRVKETDRLHAIAKELTKMGAKIEEKSDGLVIKHTPKLQFAQCDSYDDHRMAMSLAIAGAAAQGVEIIDYQCVSISYPTFFDILHTLTQGKE